MSERGRMEDLASLFLPDLLNPLEQYGDGTRIKPDDDSHSIGQERNSSISSPNSTGIGVFRYVNTPSVGGTNEPEVAGHFGYAELSQYLQSPEGQMYGTIEGFGPAFGSNINHPANFPHSSTHSFSPITRLGVGHSSHYSEFSPGDSAFAQTITQRPHMMQLHPAHTGNLSQFDNNSWLIQNESIPMSISRHQSPPGTVHTPHPQVSTEMEPPDFHIPWPHHKSDKAHVQAKQNNNHFMPSQTKPKSANTSLSQIKVDYSNAVSLQLLDMKTVQHSDDKIGYLDNQNTVTFRGFLHGRLLTNDQDNHNYVLVSSGSVDPSRTYTPQVISCYRRNYINLYLNFAIGTLESKPTIEGNTIQRFRIEVGAITDGRDGRSVSFLTNENEQELKDSRKSGDNLSMEVVNPTHTVELDACKDASYFKVKKIQFKSSTANSTNLSFQTYYRLTAKLIAEIPGGEKLIAELKSSPIIVRGRNPSFYSSRNDTLIKPRSPLFKESYSSSISALPQPEINKNEQNDGILNDATGDSSSTGKDSVSKSGEKSPNRSPKVERTEAEDAKDLEESVDTSDSESEADTREKSKSSGLSNETDIEGVLGSMMATGSGKYQYFPISSVYYLPPINVVYFPHGAHHGDSVGEGPDINSKSDSTTTTPFSQTTNDRKATSKVYFR